MLAGACGPQILSEDAAGARPTPQDVEGLNCLECTTVACAPEIDACAGDADCQCVVDCLEEEDVPDAGEPPAQVCADRCAVLHIPDWRDIDACGVEYCEACDGSGE